jgi:hypothetical protein
MEPPQNAIFRYIFQGFLIKTQKLVNFGFPFFKKNDRYAFYFKGYENSKRLAIIHDFTAH